jgi:single-strand DNA-binding protein
MVSLNRVTLIGNLGKDPEQKTVGDGKLVTFPIAMTDAWTDALSGERKERTEWANIAIWNAALGEVAMDFLKKGSRAFVETHPA